VCVLSCFIDASLMCDMNKSMNMRISIRLTHEIRNRLSNAAIEYLYFVFDFDKAPKILNKTLLRANSKECLTEAFVGHASVPYIYCTE